MAIGVNLASSLKQGIFRDLDMTWKNQYPVFEKMNNKISKKLPDSLLRNAKYGWKNSIPAVKLWNHNVGRSHQAFDDTEIDIPIFQYELTIDINIRDLKHDQLKDAREHINFGVKRFLQLPQKLFSEYLNGTAVLNPALRNAYDGVALYSATDGDGAARFGRVGGNILTGFDRTVEGFSDFLYQTQAAFLAFLDTTNEEIIFSYEDVEYSRFYVVVPRTMNEIVEKIANVSYLKTDGANNVSEGNFFATHGKFEFYVNPLLTDENSFYVFLDHPIWKPFVYRQEDSIESIWADMNNSDLAREKNIAGLYSQQEIGAGVWTPFTTIKVTT